MRRLLIGLLGLLHAQGYYLMRANQTFLGKSALHEFPTCAVRSKGGDIVIGGYANETPLSSLSDGWLMRLTSDGKEAWSLTPGGMGPDRIEDVAIKDSVLYFCGYSGSALTHPEELPVERRADFWVGAIDLMTGRLLWQHRWGSPYIDMALTLCPTPYRTLLVGGLTWVDTLMGMQGVIHILSEHTGEVAHTFLWGHSPSLIRRIRPTPEGRHFICIGEQDYRPFIAEVDYLGQVYWRTVFQFHRFPSQLQALLLSSDGRIIVGGRYGTQWGLSAFTSKGQLIWERVWSSDQLTGSIHDLAEGAEGVIYALGWQQGEVLISSEQRGGQDVWLAALTKDGQLLWERGFGGPHDEKGVAVSSTRDTLLVVASKENRFTEAPFHADAWLLLLRAVACEAIPIQIRADVPSLREKAGRPIRFWVETPPGYLPARIQWDFGDGAVAEGSPVEHTYAVPGTYSVQVQIEFKYGCREVYPPPIGLRITRP
ncbi:MAG: PKD domain-containing protein [Bacteroidia bacterium]|nr:PKD domain-containing protein [Bacteroidia bacterium]